MCPDVVMFVSGAGGAVPVAAGVVGHGVIRSFVGGWSSPLD